MSANALLLIAMCSEKLVKMPRTSEKAQHARLKEIDLHVREGKYVESVGESEKSGVRKMAKNFLVKGLLCKYIDANGRAYLNPCI